MAITDLIKEIEVDDPPTQQKALQQPDPPVKSSSYRHRFALYRKSAYINHATLATQLNQLKSFVKCIKAADSTAQVLPICSNINMHPILTIDQLNSLEVIGITSYFKPYKRTQKHISGDFHIATKLPFEELKEHPTFRMWLLQNGYNTMRSNCQTADMVHLGFLSRVCGFTYHDDLQDYITSSQHWKDKPFHFKMYFDAFTTKGKTADVLMIDADCPNIKAGYR